MRPIFKVKPVKAVNTCIMCGEEYEKIRQDQQCCSKECRIKLQTKKKQNKYGHGTLNRIRREKPCYITDEEQAQIDKEVFIKTAVHFEPPRTYKPGDPEWDTVVSTLTPLNKIPEKRFHYHRTYRPF